MTQTKRWINIRTVLEWDGQQYVRTEGEGYWYDGPMALAAEPAPGEGDPPSGNGAEPPVVPEWAQKIEDEGLKTAVAGFESQDKLFEAIGYTPPETPEPKDWREGLPDELKETADRFASREDAIRAIQALRRRDSQVRVPGKDATDAEHAAYLKAVGVPEKPEDYEFPVLPEDQMTDEVRASREGWAQLFHKLHVPKDTARALMDAVGEDVAKQQQAQIQADENFAKEQEAALRAEWKGAEFEKNKTLANRAFNEIANRAGLNLEALTKIETKDGRFLVDRAEVVRMFALIGREMAEGTLGPALSEGEMETLEEEIRSLRKQQEEAKAEGDSKRANRLYQREQELLAKQQGSRPVVGAAGRTV